MIRYALLTLVLLFGASTALAQDCVGCHEKATPGAVMDWKTSLHAEADIGCDSCHGGQHSSAEDVEKLLTVTPDTCGD